MTDVSLANILHAPTSSVVLKGQSRTKLVLQTSLLSRFLSLYELLADHCIENRRHHHSVLKGFQQCPPHAKGPRSSQQMESTLVPLVRDICVMTLVHFVVQVNDTGICNLKQSQCPNPGWSPVWSVAHFCGSQSPSPSSCWH